MEVSIFSWEEKVHGRRRGRRLASAYGVWKEDVEKFVAENPMVEEWLRKYPEKTRGIYAYNLCRYFKWLKVKEGIGLSPSQLLNEHAMLMSSRDVEERRKHLSLALKFSRDNLDFAEHSDKWKHQMFCTIASFYRYYELALTQNRGVFGRVRNKFKVKQITLKEAKHTMGSLSQRTRAILMVILHSGMSIGDVLDHFNYMWNEIEPQMSNEIIRVEMPPRKNSDVSYVTFLGRDAIHELKKWLMERQKITGKPIQSGEPIFIMRDGEALKPLNFMTQFNQKLRRLGLKKNKYQIRSHMWRKLFKTEASIPDRAIDRDIIEYIMGHTNNTLSSPGGIYDRTPEIHEEVVEGEFKKLEPYLNIYSRPEITQQSRSQEEQAFFEALGKFFEQNPDKREKFLKLLEQL